jgi:hypothetical protein
MDRVQNYDSYTSMLSSSSRSSIQLNSCINNNLDLFNKTWELPVGKSGKSFHLTPKYMGRYCANSILGKVIFPEE